MDIKIGKILKNSEQKLIKKVDDDIELFEKINSYRMRELYLPFLRKEEKVTNFIKCDALVNIFHINKPWINKWLGTTTGEIYIIDQDLCLINQINLENNPIVRMIKMDPYYIAIWTIAGKSDLFIFKA